MLENIYMFIIEVFGKAYKIEQVILKRLEATGSHEQIYNLC